MVLRPGKVGHVLGCRRRDERRERPRLGGKGRRRCTSNTDSCPKVMVRPGSGLVAHGGPGSHQNAKRKCVQSTHIVLRIGSYVGRAGPDSACFRGSPVFAGEGMQFESHLGHVFPLFSGLWAAECVQISFYGALRGPIFHSSSRSLRTGKELMTTLSFTSWTPTSRRGPGGTSG